jgi:hypothetical protein
MQSVLLGLTCAQVRYLYTYQHRYYLYLNATSTLKHGNVMHAMYNNVKTTGYSGLV